MTAHVQNLFVTNYKLLTGEINKYKQREHALWVYSETQRSDVMTLKPSSLEFSNNTRCSAEMDTLVVECVWKGGNDSQRIPEKRNHWEIRH